MSAILTCVWCDKPFPADQQDGTFAGGPLGPCCARRADAVLTAVENGLREPIKPEPSNE